MADSVIKRKTLSTVIFTGAGLGFVYFLYRKRISILKRIREMYCADDAIGNKKVEIVEDVDHCNKVILKLRNDCINNHVLGFDCEWLTVDGKRRPVALLQLASQNGLCALIRLCKFKHIPKNLREILEDEAIIKVGIVPNEDSQKLALDYGVCVASTLDLRFLAIKADKKPEGLAGIAKSILNIELDKNWKIRCSNWEALVLNDRQVDYAAKDALVAVQAYKSYARTITGKNWFNEQTAKELSDIIEPFIDAPYKEKYSKSLTLNRNEVEKTKSATPINITRRKYTTLVRTKIMYENCFLQAPDGALLCTCDKNKAQWYLKRNLGNIIEEEPFTVRLNFEPSGRAEGDVGRYYQNPKENRCVVCGGPEPFIRKNIIPRDYRKHFPEVMKNRTSHDVVLLCPDCHQISNISDNRIRKYLERTCEAPIVFQLDEEKLVENPKLKKVKSAAKALLSSRASKIPIGRQNELKSIILEYFTDQTEVTPKTLDDAVNLETKDCPENYCRHGLTVVKKYIEERGGLIELEKLWREHFLNTMKPNYMPKLWSVNHTVDRLGIRAMEGRIEANDLIIAGLDSSLLQTKKSANENK